MFASSTNLNQRKWLDTPVNNQGKIKRQKTLARLKWPIFWEMVKVEPDLFWKDYWTRASKGKFPTGFSFNGKELFYSYRNKTSKIVFRDDVINMCQLTKHMYQNNSNIYSPLDMKYMDQRRELMYSNSINDIESWGKCNTSQKNNLITYYLLSLVDEYRLNNRQKIELQQTISIGINIGAFNDKNIIIKDNYISNIEGLKWDNEYKRFYINIVQAPFKIKKPSKNLPKKNDVYCLYSHWIKLNTPKKSTKDKIVEIGINDINTSISSSYYEAGE